MMMELKDTVNDMLSDDYKRRFRAEYNQLKIRLSKLESMLKLWDDGLLKYQPTCPRSTLDLQLRAMRDYFAMLKARAVMENVKVEDV